LKYRRKPRQEPRRANPLTEKPKVFSYRSVRNSHDRPLQRGDKAAKSKKNPDNNSSLSKKLHKVVNIVILILIISGALYLSVLYPDGQIKVAGDEVYPRDKVAYEQEINRELKSSIFNRSKFTFDKAKITSNIKEKFPEIDTVDIGVPLMRHRPVIEVSLAKPSAKLVTKDSTYILDQEGRALFDQKYAAASLDVDSLLSINDDSGHEIILGKPALTELQLDFIREVIGQTSTKGYKPTSFMLSEGGTAVDTRFEGLNYYVKFSFFADARQSSGAFMAIKDQAISPGEYVDVRIPDKAFVK